MTKVVTAVTPAISILWSMRQSRHDTSSRGQPSTYRWILGQTLDRPSWLTSCSCSWVVPQRRVPISYVPLKHANLFLPQGSDGWLPLRSIVADRNPFKGCPQIEPLYKHATHGQRTLLNLVPMEDVKRRWIPMKFLHTLLPAICLALHSNEISKGQLSQLSISDMSSAGFNMLRHATLNMLRPSPACMLGWVIAVFSTCIPGIPNAWLHAVKIFAPCSGVLNKTATALDFDTLGSAMESDKLRRIPKVVALSLRAKQLQQEDPKQVVKYYKYL